MDNTQVLQVISSPNYCLELQEDLDGFKEWCMELKLQLNYSKSSATCSTNRMQASEFTYREYNRDLEPVNSYCKFKLHNLQLYHVVVCQQRIFISFRSVHNHLFCTVIKLLFLNCIITLYYYYYYYYYCCCCCCCCYYYYC